MVLRLRGAGHLMVSTLDGRVHRMSLKGTVEDLKWCMSKRLRVLTSTLTLVAEGHILSDGKNEFVLQGTQTNLVTDETIMQVSAKYSYIAQLLIKDKSSLALTIGAGGNIKQTIAPDKNNSCIWDIASAKLINIQLVNSTAFELITGLATPTTPVSYKAYVSAGMPFYEIYKEKLSTVSGTFSEVKTISQIDATQDQNIGCDFDPLKPTRCSLCYGNYIDCL